MSTAGTKQGEELPVIGYDEIVGPMTTMHRLLFYLAGLWQCLWQGRLRHYAVLVKQAKVETADFTSIRAKSSPWCMWAGTLTGRRDAVQVTSKGEELAAYTGFRRYNRAWQDRLEWDVKRKVNLEAGNEEEYLRSVVNDGRWFGTGASEEKKAAYVKAIVGKRAPIVVQGVSSLAQTVYNAMQSEFWLAVVMWLLIAGVVYCTLFRIFKARWPWEKR